MEIKLYDDYYSTDTDDLCFESRHLKYISPNIKYFINLQILNMESNYIKTVCPEIN